MTNNPAEADRGRLAEIMKQLGIEPDQLLAPEPSQPARIASATESHTETPQVVALLSEELPANRTGVERLTAEMIDTAQTIATFKAMQETKDELIARQAATLEEVKILAEAHQSKLEFLTLTLRQINEKVGELAGILFSRDRSAIPKSGVDGIIPLPVLLDAMILRADILNEGTRSPSKD